MLAIIQNNVMDFLKARGSLVVIPLGTVKDLRKLRFTRSHLSTEIASQMLHYRLERMLEIINKQYKL
jgi:hypothetical protein